MSDPISEWEDVPRTEARAEGTVKSQDTRQLRTTGGGQMNTGTLTDMACGECGQRGENVAWHGHNCYYRCPSCDAVNLLVG
jgi:hypothetical protein